jgi:beta-xylosidase
VRNTGSRTGDEVVQVYQRDLEASLTRPVRQLVGFARVTLEPGASCSVAIRIHADQLAFTGIDGALRVEPGRHELHIGRSAEDIVEVLPFEVTGQVRVVGQRAWFLPEVSVS